MAILMSTHNICFYGELTKIILELSSNTLLVCYTGTLLEKGFKYFEKQEVFLKINVDFEAKTRCERNCVIILFAFSYDYVHV